MIRRLDRYVLSELLRPFLASTGAFLVLLLSNTLYLYIALIVERGLTVALVGRLLLLSLPANLVVALPMAYMLSSMLAIGRLSRDREITALQASGVSLGRILAPMLFGAVLVSYLGWALNERVVPWSNHQMTRINQTILTQSPIPLIRANQFFPGPNNRAIYVERVEQGVLKGLTIFDLSRRQGFPQVITAKHAKWESAKLVLHDGMMRTFESSGYLKYEAAFERLDLSLDLSANGEMFAPKGVRELAAGEAYDAIKKAESQGQNVNAMLVDYHMKFALPLATFFTSLLAVPIGMILARLGMLGGVSAGIAIVFAWQLLYSYGTSLGAQGTVSPVLAAWNQNILFGAVGLGLLLWINRK